MFVVSSAGKGELAQEQQWYLCWACGGCSVAP